MQHAPQLRNLLFRYFVFVPIFPLRTSVRLDVAALLHPVEGLPEGVPVPLDRRAGSMEAPDEHRAQTEGLGSAGRHAVARSHEFLEAGMESVILL